ncbi:MAG: MFS transporter [Acidobacteriaceae bacterium]
MSTVQWLVCAVAGLGFAFDLYESLMNALIVSPVLTSLGGLKPGTQQFNLWVGLLFFLPTVIGGIFGLFGGYLTDILGRRRVLVWSILLYGVSAAAAGFAPSLLVLLLLRCTTLIGVCVEAVAALAWLAELFPRAQQREAVLGYTQVFYGAGGVMVAGAYYLAVSYGSRLPAIMGGHEAWRYTLISGLIPAIPLMIVRPFLPESPIWQDQKLRNSLKRPSIMGLFASGTRKTVLLTTLMLACVYAIPFGALQHTPRIVPGIAQLRTMRPQEVQQAVSVAFLVQELGSVTGRFLFAFLVVRFMRRQPLLRLFLIPALALIPWIFFSATKNSLTTFIVGIFCAQALFNGLHSFWGNYLPRVYPTYLRCTGESFAMNIGGKTIGVFAVLMTTQLANVMPGSSPAARLTYSAGTTVVFALAVLLVASFWLPEPQQDGLPE